MSGTTPSKGRRRLLERGLDAVAAVYSRDGIAWSAPQFAAIGAFLVAYGVGLIGWGSTDTHRPLVIAAAVAIGLVGWIVGTAVGWRPGSGRGPREGPRLSRWLLPVGLALVLAGWLSLIVYFVRIGTLPILLQDVESARVAAAAKGGAALRMLSFSSLLGAWILAADAGARRSVGRTGVAAVVTLATAAGFVLTANRSQAFEVVAVAAVAWTLAAGYRHARARLVATGALVIVALVIGAGLLGAVRYALSPGTWNDPQVQTAVERGDWPALTGIAIGNYLRVPVRNFDLTMQAVPAVIPFQLGHTYLQPALTALPGKQTTFDADLKRALGETYAGGGTVPSLLGEAWANFGPFGWLLVPLVVGSLLAATYGVACRVDGPATWALYAWLLIHVVGANLSGLLVASPFPYMAAAILGGLAWIEARRARGPAVGLDAG